MPSWYNGLLCLRIAFLSKKEAFAYAEEEAFRWTVVGGLADASAKAITAILAALGLMLLLGYRLYLFISGSRGSHP